MYIPIVLCGVLVYTCLMAVSGERGERATAGKLLKFTPSELERIECHARVAGLSSSVWIKRWLAEVCVSLERERGLVDRGEGL